MVGAKESSSSLHQQRGKAAIRGRAPNNSSVNSERVTHLASNFATRVEMSLKLKGRNFLVVEMKTPSFFRRTPQDNILDLVVAYKHKDETHNDGNRFHVLA